MNIYLEIENLLKYSIIKKLIKKDDEIFLRNRILEILDLDEYEKLEVDTKYLSSLDYPCEILDKITNWAGEKGRLKENILVYKDILNARIMGNIISRPSIIRDIFWNKYRDNKKLATDYFYEISKQSNYIRTDRISKNVSYKYKSKYGELDITINLSKPEKDPKEIALAKNAPLSKYPKSILCKENEGYMGRINHPARQNHRIIPITLNNEDWFFQYSPYTYYNEHSIAFSSEIRPMKIDKFSFKRLIDFIEIFPHYFIGSNADLPIVGGSILSHDHFQAGRYEFAMEKSNKEQIRQIGEVKLSIVDWAMSVIRLNSNNKNEIIEVADKILQKWIKYNENNIVSHTGDIRHNTITPIARFNGNEYELDLVLRNNLTSDEYPLGIYHPHTEYHNIKKENIGLIEVMGLAVLPSRLKEEMQVLQSLIEASENVDELIESMNNIENQHKHIEWIKRYVNDENLKNANVYDFVGHTFEKVLENCKVLNEQSLKEFIKKI
ncbi:UDP-glucose--hexose-1-phosphate uridylyltransferase [Oceanivirga salmonicida]|uniref:UDP-glucose--hexose-1-phosphate uridylyltransferase n=1 Tax=Oceanivirga salmonicida TaxID=1769291 RepID=UPI00082F069B|nr:UDP-glucose--hexose-1-phosphate uridylyltransferase [Oceanivirga salmonicida]